MQRAPSSRGSQWPRSSASRRHARARSHTVPRNRPRRRLGASEDRRGAIPTCRASGDTRRPCRSSGPRSFQGRESLTDEEVAESQRVEDGAGRRSGWRAPKARPWVGGTVEQSPIRGNEYNSFWQDHGRPRQVFKQTSLDRRSRGRPASRIRPTPKKAEARATARYGAGPYESYLDPDTGERCLTDGVTALMWQGPNGGHNRIVQSPGYVTILHEEYLDRRIIPTDGRQHERHPAVVRRRRRASGTATRFVVETTNFIDRTNYEWATIFTRPSETLHLVERFTRTGANTMDYRITVEDPTTFERPWTAHDSDHAAARRDADLRIRLP